MKSLGHLKFKHLCVNLLIILISTLPATSIAQEWPVKMDSVLQQLAADSLFDGQVLIAEKGEVLFSGAYGHPENEPDREAIDRQTAFVVYSVGKSMTALSILMLYEEGRLDLSDPLQKYFPQLPYQGVTIRHLLNMTSGLPRFLETALKADTTQVMDNEAIIELIAQKQPTAGNPGDSLAYNNANYLLLASIVEKVLGKSFGDFLKKNIFKPLKMKHSREVTAETITELAGKPTNAENFYQITGTGSVATTAEDLFKYDRALYTDRLVKQSTLDMAFAPTELNDGQMSDYGFGWRVTDNEPWGKEIYHVGDGRNMRASLQRFTDAKKTFIYIHAYTNEYHEGVYWALRNIWESKPYELPQKRIKYNIDPTLLKKYVGSYLSGFGLVHVSLDEGQLYLRPDAIEGKEPLIPSSDTTFYFTNQNLEWEFFLADDGSVAGFGIKGNREQMGLQVEE